MVESDPGCDAPGEESVDQLVIKGNSLFIDRVISASDWYNAGPCQGKSVGFGAILLQEIEVFLKSVVVVTSDVAIDAAVGRGVRVKESVPNAWSTATFVDSALNLVSGGCETPLEI
jgi:hypothetical protein